VDLVHRVVTHVLWEGTHAVLGASEQDAEVLVQVGEKGVLGRHGVVGWHVHHEGSGSSAVKEVLGNSDAASVVGRVERTIEVWEEVDGSSVVGTLGQDTWNHDTDVWLGVVTNDGGVDEEGQESVLVLGGVVLEKGGGVLVADRRLGLGDSQACCREHGSDVGELHVDDVDESGM